VETLLSESYEKGSLGMRARWSNIKDYVEELNTSGDADKLKAEFVNVIELVHGKARKVFDREGVIKGLLRCIKLGMYVEWSGFKESKEYALGTILRIVHYGDAYVEEGLSEFPDLIPCLVSVIGKEGD